MLLILRHGWQPGSTEKYPLDTLLGVYWESVLHVGFRTQRALDLLKVNTIFFYFVCFDYFRMIRLVAFASNEWDNDPEVMPCLRLS
jgi:hypothetical protein